MSTPYYPEESYSDQSGHRSPTPLPQQYPPPRGPQQSRPPQQYPSTYPYPPYPRRRINKKAFASMVMFIITIVLLSVAIFLPWYSLTGDLEGEMNSTSSGTTISADLKMDLLMEMSLQEGSMNMDADVTSMGQTQSLTESDTYEYNDEEIKPVMDNTFYLTILSIIFAILAMIFAVIVGAGFLSFKIGALFSALAMVLVLITMLYFYVALPTALEKNYENSESEVPLSDYGMEFDGSFMGSSSATKDITDTIPDAEGLDEAPMDMKWSWGPMYGWFLTIVAFAFALIGLLLMTGAKEKRLPHYPYPSQPQSYPEPMGRNDGRL